MASEPVASARVSPMNMKAVLASAFGIEFVISIIRPLVSQYAASLGADTLGVGLIASTYAIFPLLVAVHVGRVTDLVGSRIPAVLGATGMAGALGLPFLFDALWSLYLSQAVVGISHLLAVVAMQNVVGRGSTPETRDHRFALFSLAVSSGAFLGPILGGYIADHLSFASAYLSASLLGVPVVLLTLLLPSTGKGQIAAPQRHDGNSLALLKIPRLRIAMLTSALVLYSRDIFVVYFPLYAMQAGLSSTTIGWLIGIQALSVVAVRFFLGRLTAAVGRQRVLVGSIVLAGASFLVIPASAEIILLALLSALMGLGLGCGQPLSMSTAYTAAPKFRTAEVLGLRLASNRLSQLVAPLLFGVTGAWLGLLSVFYLSGAFLLGGAALTYRSEKNTRD